jgi:hypothetical protein
MTKREHEHYTIARSFNRPFGYSEFITQLQQEYPKRPRGSIMPYEFCRNRLVASSTNGPKFMIRLERGWYCYSAK